MYNGINVCYMSIQHDFLWWIESFYALFSLSQCPCIYIIVAVAMSNCSHHRRVCVHRSSGMRQASAREMQSPQTLYNTIKYCPFAFDAPILRCMVIRIYWYFYWAIKKKVYGLLVKWRCLDWLDILCNIINFRCFFFSYFGWEYMILSGWEIVKIENKRAQ